MTVWTNPLPPYTEWVTLQTDDTPRITEDGSTRITEDGNIRIIERFAFQWTIPLPPYTLWTPQPTGERAWHRNLRIKSTST